MYVFDAKTHVFCVLKCAEKTIDCQTEGYSANALTSETDVRMLAIISLWRKCNKYVVKGVLARKNSALRKFKV